MPGLTDQQQLFCREYLSDRNATQAAIRAGYSKTSAAPTSSAHHGTARDQGGDCFAEP